MGSIQPDAVLAFWFEELDQSDWFKRSDEVDQTIRQRFSHVHQEAIHGALWDWRSDVKGRLAEIIVLDQFSRNLYRDSPAAFAADSMALVLAQEAIDRGLAAALEPTERAFLYMPFMHSESPAMHERAMVLFAEPGLEHNLDFEQQHKVIIDRFGRYPHRNAVLGRDSTTEEIAFLREDGSSF